jgi:hypothetical protein
MLPCRVSAENASLIGGLTKPKTIRQQAVGFIRWRKLRGYEITPFRRQFWGKKAWQKREGQKLCRFKQTI